MKLQSKIKTLFITRILFGKKLSNQKLEETINCLRLMGYKANLKV